MDKFPNEYCEQSKDVPDTIEEYARVLENKIKLKIISDIVKGRYILSFYEVSVINRILGNEEEEQ